MSQVRIYFDVCCLNRPFDDQSQARIHLESEAVLIILNQCQRGQWEWIGSEVVNWEIVQTPDPERRRRMQLLATHIHCMISVGQFEITRAQQIQSWGITAFDALHLACAESGRADIFLTTDDRLLRKATAHTKQLHIRVANPLMWLKEVSQ